MRRWRQQDRSQARRARHNPRWLAQPYDLNFGQVTAIYFKPFQFSTGRMKPAMYPSAKSSARDITRQIGLLFLDLCEY